MNSRGYNQLRHIHNRDSLSPDFVKFIERVLEAAGDLQSNIFLFPDVDSEVNLAPERGKIYGMIRRILGNGPSFAPVDDAALIASHVRGYFPAVIWISSLALSPDYVPPIFRTGVLAHELGHARQIERAEEIGDVLDAWDCYEDFLAEKQQQLSYWTQPHEIDAELFARKVIRQLHPDEILDPLLGFTRTMSPFLNLSPLADLT